MNIKMHDGIHFCKEHEPIRTAPYVNPSIATGSFPNRTAYWARNQQELKTPDSMQGRVSWLSQRRTHLASTQLGSTTRTRMLVDVTMDSGHRANLRVRGHSGRCAPSVSRFFGY